MARVTVEDCVQKIPNRFDLVLIAGQRAREIASGSQLTIDRDNDKNPVVALREIADATVDPPALMESLIKEHQKHGEVDEPVEEEMDLLAIEKELLSDGGAGQELRAADVDEELLAGDEDGLDAEAQGPADAVPADEDNGNNA